MELSKEQVLGLANDHLGIGLVGRCSPRFMAFANAIARLATEAQAEKVRELLSSAAELLSAGVEYWSDGDLLCHVSEWDQEADRLAATIREHLATPPAAGDAQDAARWIPVSERLPELDTEFAWLATKDGEVLSGTRGWQQGWSPDYWDTRELGMIDFENVTHWQPVKVPAPPAMQKGADDE